MKMLLGAAAFLILSGGTRVVREDISFGLEEGVTLLRTFEALAEYEDDGYELWLDDEEAELPESDGPTVSSESLERIVVRDEILEVVDGRPTDFLRTFVELSQDGTTTLGEEEFESSYASELADVTVRFLWDDEEETWSAEAEDDDDLDEELLAWLTGDMDLALFLPDEPVEVGDSWEIPVEAYLTLMWPGGLVRWHGEDDTDEQLDDDDDRNRQGIENLDGEGTARFVEVRDEDGVRVAVIEVELSIETWSELESEADAEAGIPEIELLREYERELEGELLWDLDHGHLHSAIFETDSEVTNTQSYTIEQPAVFDVEEIRRSRGTIEYEVSVERE